MKYAEVAVDAPVGHGRTFTYSIPDPISLRPGHQVRVPFGPRTLQGVVFELASVPQVPETRDVIDTVYPDSVVSEARLTLARWVSDYYLSGLFEAVALMLPPGSRVRPRTYLSLAEEAVDPTDDTLPESQRRIIEFVARRGTLNQERLFNALGQGIRSPLNRLVDAGIVARTVGRNLPTVRSQTRQVVRPGPDAPLVGSEGFETLSKQAPKQTELLAYLLDRKEPVTIAEARREYSPSALRSLVAKGWVEVTSETLDRDPLVGYRFERAGPITLTADQSAAARRIREAIEDVSITPRTLLIEGVTGSGKTKVYMDAVDSCVGTGKKAIVMVPEIALTHQTVERFAARFPGKVAVLHSGLTSGQRFDQWWKVQRGEFDVVIGSRSAVFAPQPNLGLIVLDEEHEWTYKQADAEPRYHARDAAIRLAELTGAVTVLGSASPDVGTYYRARLDRFGLLQLPDRLAPDTSGGATAPARRRLPKVDVVDMKEELRRGNNGIFSVALDSAIGDVLDSGGQLMLFLNRRGAASFLQCRSCGESLKCTRCDVSLTYHRGADRMVCHYCGYRRKRPDECPYCLRYRMSLYGIGTEGVVNEVEQRYPGASVVRWDRDTTRQPGDNQRLLQDFRSGKAQVMVGTQMIAKGLHFPSVALVGVVSGDIGLNVPDFRSGERSFQLLYQVAGRAGRGEVEGRVIIQTYQPDNYAIRAAASQDYLNFYLKEMGHRREQDNPPFSKLVRLLFVHTNRAHSERLALGLSENLRMERDAWGYGDTEVLGPTPGYPPRLRGRYRWQLVIRGADPRRLLDKITVPHGWTVDIDPVSAA